MVAALNILILFLLSGYAFITLISKPTYVSLSKTEKVLLTGREKFLLLTIMTGMIRTGGFSLGLNLSAWHLVIWIAMILLAFFLYRRSPWVNVLILFYTLFLAWMALSLTWTNDVYFGIRVIMKYFYPFAVLLFAMTFVRSKDFIFVVMKWLIVMAIVFSVLLSPFTERYVFALLPQVLWHRAAFIDFLAIMSGLSYLMWWRTSDRRYLYLIGWFLMICILDSVRTGVLGMLNVFMVASYLRYKALALPYIAGTFAFALIAVLFIPQIREKMFYDPSAIQTVGDLESIDQDQIDSNGRFAMWEWTMDEYYVGHEWTGSGIGIVQERFYSGNHPFRPIKIIHNDYVQMLCDVGRIGLGLYVAFVLLSMNTARHYVKKKMPLYLQNASFLVVTSFVATLTTMMTDNVVNYANSVHAYPFIFLGIMLAYRKQFRYELEVMRRHNNDRT